MDDHGDLPHIGKHAPEDPPPPIEGWRTGFARNMAKHRVATFALSRFLRIEPTGARFTLPVDFDPEVYANNAFGITGGEKLRDGVRSQE